LLATYLQCQGLSTGPACGRAWQQAALDIRKIHTFPQSIAGSAKVEQASALDLGLGEISPGGAI